MGGSVTDRRTSAVREGQMGREGERREIKRGGVGQAVAKLFLPALYVAQRLASRCATKRAGRSNFASCTRHRR
eukprot:39633-Chlamydomonas_euryale.AAC.4